MERDYFSINQLYEMTTEGEHQIQAPIHVGPETLAMELKVCMSVMDCDGFVSYKDTQALGLFIRLLTDKLELYYKEYPEEARMAAEKMVAILAETDTDDDMFPWYEVEYIQRCVDLPVWTLEDRWAMGYD